MPRVILRTIEPAKLLACQSVEKALHPPEAFLGDRLHDRELKRMMQRNARWRSAIMPTPSAQHCGQCVEGSDAREIAIALDGAHRTDQSPGKQRHQHVRHGGRGHQHDDRRHQVTLPTPMHKAEAKNVMKRLYAVS